MGGWAGLTTQGGLYACEDYWQYTCTKQLWKANNCLKVNNNTMLWGGVITNQIELISPTYVSFMRCSYEEVTLGLYSWLMHRNMGEGEGFCGMHK